MIYAGFWRRFIALLLDGIFIWLTCTILIIPYFIYPLCFIVAAFYHVVFETSPLKATPGKALLKMSVAKSDGSALAVKDSLIRFGVSFLSSALLCFGYLISLFTQKRQTLHDFIADTVVIDGTLDDANFWKIFVDQTKVLFGSNKTIFNHDQKIDSKTLEELYALYQKGILTEDEYKNKKEEYLKRL